MNCPYAKGSIMFILYDAIFLIFAIIYLPYLFFTKKFHKGLWQRLGLYQNISGSRGSIWLHAVSVGEVVAIKPLWARLRKEYPSKRILISTITRTGNEIARKFANDNETVFYLPLDLSFVIDTVLRRIRPDVLVIAETEIWPNLIGRCFKKGVPVVLVNGRISDKAFGRYRLFKFLFSGLLTKITSICARSGQDSDRFIALGALPQRVRISGNIKYCGIGDAGHPVPIADVRRKLSIGDRDRVITAGSTHKGEDEIILDVFKKLSQDFKNLRLVIVPRYVERGRDIRKLAQRFPVSVIDKFGILNELYQIADIVFVGGSLCPHGGHNIIEPAVFSKPVIFGPYMFNFKDVAVEFLKNDAAIEVNNKDELEINLRRLLSDKDKCTKLGAAARKVVLDNQGALEISLNEVKKALI